MILSNAEELSIYISAWILFRAVSRCQRSWHRRYIFTYIRNGVQCTFSKCKSNYEVSFGHFCTPSIRYEYIHISQPVMYVWNIRVCISWSQRIWIVRNSTLWTSRAVMNFSFHFNLFFFGLANTQIIINAYYNYFCYCNIHIHIHTYMLRLY